MPRAAQVLTRLEIPPIGELTYRYSATHLPALSPDSTPDRLNFVATKHMDRLSAVDASFLAQEGRSSHMHVGAVLLFEGPPPQHDELIAHVESRLQLVPRYRQKLAHTHTPNTPT